jgi:hypothetical protein
MMINDYVYKMIYDFEKKQDERLPVYGHSVKPSKTVSSNKPR